MARRKKKPVTVAGLDATPERLAMAQGATAIGADKVRRVMDCPIDTLHAKRTLDPFNSANNEVLYMAGKKFSEIYASASYELKAQDVSASRSCALHRGMPFTVKGATARDTLAEIRGVLGYQPWCVVERVVGQGFSVPDCFGLVAEYGPGDMARAVVLDRLRTGLATLAVHFGFSRLRPDRVIKGG